MAAAASLSERTLARRLETHTGVAPMKWLAAQRAERAMDLLETTATPSHYRNSFSADQQWGREVRERRGKHRRM
ncbi:helix-turn-helix domain-containing protein [Arthrobacter sp. LAPM80]|uniref:helix-turn-helix domain-containing protein n=1 Tax=Arthrobacter sp. LAPM80 TaxID=3141788 RepID=UPI00398AA7A2